MAETVGTPSFRTRPTRAMLPACTSPSSSSTASPPSTPSAATRSSPASRHRGSTPSPDARGIIAADTRRLGLLAWRDFTEVTATDILYVPGGPGAYALETNEPFLAYLRALDATSTWTVGICNGVGLLGAAGLLEGKRATTNWFCRDRLAAHGATFVAERYHRDGKYVTGAGVSASIDTGLFLAQLIAGDMVAKAIQLGIEYYPSPPFAEKSPRRGARGRAGDHPAARGRPGAGAASRRAAVQGRAHPHAVIRDAGAHLLGQARQGPVRRPSRASAVGVRSYRGRIGAMPLPKRSVWRWGREELRLAKTAAREAGVSLSAFVTEAVRDRLTEKRRREAAREVLAMFGPDDFPTPEHERELLELWSTPAEVTRARRAERARAPAALHTRNACGKAAAQAKRR